MSRLEANCQTLMKTNQSLVWINETKNHENAPESKHMERSVTPAEDSVTVCACVLCLCSDVWAGRPTHVGKLLPAWSFSSMLRRRRGEGGGTGGGSDQHPGRRGQRTQTGLLRKHNKRKERCVPQWKGNCSCLNEPNLTITLMVDQNPSRPETDHIRCDQNQTTART